MKILILGGSGMLGHAFYNSWRQNFDVKATLRGEINDYVHSGVLSKEDFYEGVDILEFDHLEKIVYTYQPDCIVNCIGITKKLCNEYNIENVLSTNAIFPHKLSELTRRAGARLIQLSSDCIYSGKKGNYSEDDLSDADDLYGKSKSLGELQYQNCLTLRKSTIGLELENKHGLIEWFLDQKGSIKGFDKAIYSGFTSTYLANIISQIIFEFPNLEGIYNLASSPISKYELLKKLETKIDNFHIDIVRDDKINIDRSLDSSKIQSETGIKFPEWDEMLDDLGEEINRRKNDVT